MSDVLLVQNTRIEGSGYLGELLSNDGFDITSIHAKYEAIPEKKFSFVVILGAPESANDDLPYLLNEQKLIKNSVDNEIPVLGICLGSQLIAKTFGAKVYKGPIKEIGFYNDLKFSNNSKLFDGFTNPFSVFNWHGDTFDLPDGDARDTVVNNIMEEGAIILGSGVNTIRFRPHLNITTDEIDLGISMIRNYYNICIL